MRGQLANAGGVLQRFQVFARMFAWTNAAYAFALRTSEAAAMTANINQDREIRVLCVDDDELVGQIIRITLKHAGGFEWLGQLHSADELLDRSRQEAPDVVLLDLCMPGKSAFVAMQELIALCPTTRILLFTGYAGQNLIDRAIEAG